MGTVREDAVTITTAGPAGRVVRVVQSFLDRGGARINAGECIRLAEADAARAIRQGLAVDPDEPPTVASVGAGAVSVRFLTGYHANHHNGPWYGVGERAMLDAADAARAIAAGAAVADDGAIISTRMIHRAPSDRMLQTLTERRAARRAGR